jgi:hypothetical protein
MSRKALTKVLFAATILATAVLAAVMERRAHATADDPTIGGCVICAERNPDNTCKVCTLSAHPTVIQPLAAIDLKTSKLSYGLEAVSPGICYGVTYGPSKWYASGAAFCLNLARLEGADTVFPSGVVQLLKWGEHPDRVKVDV